MARHRLIIGTILSFIGVIFILILIRIYGRFDGVSVEFWQQLVYTIMVAMAMLQMGTGLSLMMDRYWPKKLNIFVASFNLVVFPIGTFAGLYYFWYLMRLSAIRRNERYRYEVPEKTNSEASQ